MKKLLAVLIAVMFIGATTVTPALAAEPLTDSELDSIDAGTWIVVEQPDGYKEVHEVYHTVNDFLIEDEAQKDIQAVANTNVIDSAVAVQTNISSATGAAISNDIEGHNEANIINYNPSDYSAYGKKAGEEWHKTLDAFNSLASSDISGENHVEWSSASASDTFDYDETLDINYAAASAGSGAGQYGDSTHYSEEPNHEGGYGSPSYGREGAYSRRGGQNTTSSYGSSHKQATGSSASAEVLNVDYDKTIDAGWASDEESHLDWSKFSDASVNQDSSQSASEWHSSVNEESGETRTNLAEWNGLLLVETAQTNLQVVSNLNAVSSGAAVQTNIASNVGVGGSIKHSSSATVINGL